MKNLSISNTAVGRFLTGNSGRFFMYVLLALFSTFARAQGLDDATDEANDIKDWAYGFLGVCVFLYLIYMVVMAFLDKKQWSEVMQAVGYVALAGAIIVIGEYAWGIWGS